MSLIRSSFRRPSSTSTKAEMSIMPSHQLVATPTWPLQHVHMRSTFSTRTFSKAEAIAPSWLHGCMAAGLGVEVATPQQLHCETPKRPPSQGDDAARGLQVFLVHGPAHRRR